MRFFYLFFLAVFYLHPASAAPYIYDYNENCSNAYKEYLALRLDEGNTLIKKELTTQPANLTAVFLSDYSDFFTLLFNGDKNAYEARKNNLDRRIALLEKGSKNTPWYRTCKAGIYMHWAMIHMRIGEELKAVKHFRKAYLLAKENQALFPDFPQNNFFMGVCETVVGTVPDEYKWIAKLFGMKGSVNKGLAKLTDFINTAAPDDALRSEALIFHCYLKFYLQSRQEEVWKLLNSAQFSTQGNALNSFVKANIALNYRHADIALQTLQTVQNMKAYSLFPAFDYEMGSALLLKLDDKATHYFSRFIARDKGNLFIKDALMQMAQSYYLQGNLQKANSCRQQIKTRGNSFTDSDKQALRFANSHVWTPIPLLKARYLIDGGYYAKALEILSAYTIESLPAVADQLEYHFRIARAYDELNQDNKAVHYYQLTINKGRNRKEHFAARAALQMGMMYERLGKTKEAVTMYKDCLSMRDHDFQSNIDQQAKAALNRLGL